MKRFILPILLLLSLTAESATEKLVLDTKTHVLTTETGGTVIDARNVTLTLGGVTISDASGVKTIITGSTSGTKFGDTGNKIGFLGAAPIARPTGNIFSALTAFGLVTSPSLTIANVTSLQTSLDAKADSTAVVHVTGNETVAGTKIFSSAPSVPDNSFSEAKVTGLVADLAAKANNSAVLHNTGNETASGNKSLTGATTTDALASRSITLNAIANPDTPTVVSVGSVGVSTWSYRIVAKLTDGTTTTSYSPAGSVTSGYPTLSGTNYNAISWAAVAGAASYDVYRVAVGTSPATTGKIATVTSNSYNDQGAAGDGSTPPAVNSTGAIVNQLVAAAGVTAYGPALFVADTVAAGGVPFGIRSNLSGAYPASHNGQNANFSIGTNFSGGGSETNFFNNNVGAPSGGFRFQQKTGTSSALDLMWIRGNGGVTIGNPTQNPGPGGLRITPAAPEVQGLRIEQNLTGNVAVGDYAANQIRITSDDAAFDSSGSAFLIQHTYGGSALRAGRNSLEVQSVYNGPTPTAYTGGGAGNYVAGYFGVDVKSGTGGTDLNDGARGGFFGLNPAVVLFSGITNVGEISGAEFNLSARTGSSVKYKNILSLVYLPDDAVDGSDADCMLALSSQSPNRGKNGILFGAMNGGHPVKTTGNLIATTGAATAKNGIYFPDYVFTDWALYAPHGAANVSSLTTTSVTAATETLTSNDPDALRITGNSLFYTGPRIVNTDGSSDWGIYAGGSVWGGEAGALVLFDNNTPGPKFIFTKSGQFRGATIVAFNPAGESPGSPEAGMIYYNGADHHFYGYNGTTWKQLDN